MTRKNLRTEKNVYEWRNSPMCRRGVSDFRTYWGSVRSIWSNMEWLKNFEWEWWFVRIYREEI